MSSTSGDPARGVSESLFSSFERSLTREIVTATLRRAIIVNVVLAVISAAFILSEGRREPHVFYLMGGCILLQGVLLWAYQRRLHSPHAMACIAGLGILNLLWLVVMGFLQLVHLNELALALLLISLGLAGIPWRASVSVIFCAATWLLSAVALSLSRELSPLLLSLWGGILLLVPLLGIKFTLESRLSLFTRVSQSFLGSYCESVASSALATMHLLAYQLRTLMGAHMALVLTSAGQKEIVSDRVLSLESVEPVYARTLLQKLKDKGVEQGIFARRDLGEDFDSRFLEWFGMRPRILFLFKLLMVRDEQETEVVLAVCPSSSSLLVGRSRLFLACMGLVSLARLSLSSARSRFLASDSLLTTQRSVSEREEELTELVHLVNNVAQDIAMRCEDLHQGVEAVGRGEAHEALKDKLKGDVRELEAASRNLSTGVSDRKLLKELLRTRKSSRKEQAAINPVLEDLSLFGLYHGKRRNISFRIHSELEPSVAVELISREFLESCSRQLLRELFERCAQRSEVKLRVRLFNQRCEFELSVVEAGESAAHRSHFSDFKTLPAFSAFSHFISLSGGDISPSALIPGSHAAMRFALIAASLSTRKLATKGRWALFVDDNTQVTDFYGRVAQALNLPFSAAGSVQEALQLLENEGQPRLIITDLQLGDKSGLEIVREARKRFGVELPVIVVSGNLSEEVKLQVAQVGATNFLAKPVGRARLFAEIQSILESKVRK